MKRRDFLSTFAASAAALWPAVGHAQEKPVPVIGVLDGGDPGPFLTEFGRGLRDLGYVEGRNIQIEVRSAAGKSELLRSLAEELTRSYLPSYVNQLLVAVPGISPQVVIGLPIMLFMLIVALGQPYLGSWSERVGRRKAMLVGAGIRRGDGKRVILLPHLAGL